jgi:hypothetical protein
VQFKKVRKIGSQFNLDSKLTELTHQESAQPPSTLPKRKRHIPPAATGVLLIISDVCVCRAVQPSLLRLGRDASSMQNGHGEGDRTFPHSRRKKKSPIGRSANAVGRQAMVTKKSHLTAKLKKYFFS